MEASFGLMAEQTSREGNEMNDRMTMDEWLVEWTEEGGPDE